MRKSKNVVDMLGRRFGSLVVTERAGSVLCKSGASAAAWRCACDCGQTVVVRGDWLRQGFKKACGVDGHYYRPVGATDFPDEYRAWQAMQTRCYNSNDSGYKHYGAKGVKVCARWRDSFKQFLADMGPRPSLQHSLDRYPNPHGNYKPTNCRWATDKEQALNKRATRRVTVDGRKISLMEYCEKLGISPAMVRKRLYRGWSIERAVVEAPYPNRNDYPEDWMSGEAFKKKEG